MRSVPQKRQNAVAHEFGAHERRTALRRPELDAVGPGIPELDDPGRHLLRRARNAEAFQRRRLARLEPEGRIEVRDDVEVRLNRRLRPLAGPVAVLVDDADR
jgi:hypothetical protein